MKKYVLFLLIPLFAALVYFVAVGVGVADTAVLNPEPIATINNIPHLTVPPQRYIVQFSAPPLAVAMQHTTAVSAYRSYLAGQQDRFLTATTVALGRPLQPLYRYDAAFNGMTVLLRGDEVAVVEEMAGVTAVYPDLEETILTDTGPTWIGADSIWDGSSVPTTIGNKGEGIIVGIIDTGINMDHPSFADIGGDGYDHTNPRGKFYGWCDPDHPKLMCSTDKIYQKFLSKVAEGRNLTIEEVNEIAQGRVWSGRQGVEVGLVDTLGTLEDAIAIAALAVGTDDYKILQYPVITKTFYEEILSGIMSETEAQLGPLNQSSSSPMMNAIKLIVVMDFIKAAALGVGIFNVELSTL